MMVGVAAPTTISCSGMPFPTVFEQQDIVHGPFKKIVAALQIKSSLQALANRWAHYFHVEYFAVRAFQQAPDCWSEALLTHEIGPARRLEADFGSMHKFLWHIGFERALERSLINSVDVKPAKARGEGDPEY